MQCIWTDEPTTALDCAVCVGCASRQCGDGVRLSLSGWLQRRAVSKEQSRVQPEITTRMPSCFLTAGSASTHQPQQGIRYRDDSSEQQHGRPGHCVGGPPDAASLEQTAPAQQQPNPKFAGGHSGSKCADIADSSSSGRRMRGVRVQTSVQHVRSCVRRAGFVGRGSSLVFRLCDTIRRDTTTASPQERPHQARPSRPTASKHPRLFKKQEACQNSSTTHPAEHGGRKDRPSF